MLNELFGSGSRGNSSSRNRETHKPRLETLEDRAVPAVIAGSVYHDLNNNGVRDVNERGIANNTLQLVDGNNRVVATTVTDSNGEYRFTRRNGANPGPGLLTREVVFNQSKTNVTKSGTVAMFDPTMGQLLSVEIVTEGSLNSAVVMENLEDTATAMGAHLDGNLRYQVGGQSLQASPTQRLQATLGAFDGQADLQGSSARDFGVTRMQGSFSRVVLSNASDISGFIGTGTVNVTKTASVKSCAEGTGNLMAMIRSTTEGRVRVIYRYQPGNALGPGDYTIIQKTQPAGFVDGQETRDNFTVLPGSNRTDRIRVGIVNASDQRLENHFGELRAASLSGMVYHDVNRSGRFTAGDNGIGNVLVTLTGTDVFGNAVSRSTTTDAAGKYAFGGLTPGSYVIRETQPGGFQQGTNNIGSLGGTIAGDTMNVSVDQGQRGVNYNFGEVYNGSGPAPLTGGGTTGKTPFMWNYNGSFNW
ncbi:MAG: SdrD B-like domain-containing protein [Gemmataceae bacterium]